MSETEKKEETAFAEFKAKKIGESKRKDDELIGNPSKRMRRILEHWKTRKSPYMKEGRKN